MQSLFSTQRSVIPNHQVSTANGNILPAINSVFSDYILRLVRNICASVGQPITTEKLLVFFVSYVNYFTIHYQHRGKLNA